MENLLIYEMESESQSEGKSQQHEQEPTASRSTEKQEYASSIVETRTVHVHSHSSEDSPQKLLKGESELVFYDEELIKSTTSMDVDETKRVFIKRQAEQQNDSDYESQEEDEVMELDEGDEVQSMGSPNVRATRPFPKGSGNGDVTVKANRIVLIKQVVPVDYKLTCFLSIQSNFLGMVSCFRLFLGEKREFLLSAKKEVFKLMSSFTISNHSREINRRSESFVAVLQGNFIGTEFKLMQVREEIEQLRLVVNYEKNIVGFNGPRMFTATKVHPEVKRRHGMEGMLQNQRQKLIEMRTAVPVLKKGTYRLDFERKAKMPSAKNFILEGGEGVDKNGKRNVVMFCKIKEDEFLVEISYPLSILQAFGICLSSLDSKLMVN